MVDIIKNKSIQKNYRRRRASGFSLVEVMVVIGIVAILVLGVRSHFELTFDFSM